MHADVSTVKKPLGIGTKAYVPDDPAVTLDFSRGFMLKDHADLLVVEDDPQLRLLMHTLLTQSGYAVRSARDGIAALAEIAKAVPDMVLSDLYMPGMSGFEFLSEVRRTLPHIPLIAMSSAFSGTAVPPGVVADAFYEKASSVHTLLALLESRRPIAA